MHTQSAFGSTGDEARAAEHKSTLEEKLKVYDVILSKQRFLAGEVSLHPTEPG